MNNAMTYEQAPQPETAQSYVDSLTVPYAATFVPQSMSRNKDDANSSLNWRVTFGGMSVEYMQGIGHLPRYNHSTRNAYYLERVREACERGVEVSPTWPHNFGRKLAAPKLVDVLYSLVLDSEVIEHDEFADWADCFGYDDDSIAAREIYDACMREALRLRGLINLDEARIAFQDY